MTTQFHMDALRNQQMKFILLARANDGAEISKMISKGIVLRNHRFSNGKGPLHVAACLGHDHAIDALLPVFNPLATDDQGRTPFMLAASYGRVDSAMKLLRAAPEQATPELLDQLEKMRPEFIHNGQIDPQLLLPLCSAIKEALDTRKHLSQFSNLAGHSMKTREISGRIAADLSALIKSLPIHEAAKRFELDALSRHLNMDAARAVDEKGRTPLHWAARAGFDLGVASLLPFLSIDDIRLPDFDGQSASDLARSNHRPHLASMIDQFGKSLMLAQQERSISLEEKSAPHRSESLHMKLQMEKHREEVMAKMAESEMELNSKLRSSKENPSDEAQNILDQRERSQERNHIARGLGIKKN